MKYYLRFIWVGVLSGIFCILGYAIQSRALLLSDIVALFGMREIECYVQFLSNIAYWYIPLLFFQALYGTYVYRHFCTASVYFFSRYTKRTSWFLRESCALYFMGLIYLIMMLVAAIVCSALFSNVIIDEQSAKIFLYYIGIYSLYLFVTTMGINIIAIIFNSNSGFLVVEGVNLFSITLFALVGNFFAPEGFILEEYEWILKINPFYYLVFGMKIQDKDYLTSLELFMVLAIVTWLIGCRVVNKRDFIGGNKEVGGM